MTPQGEQASPLVRRLLVSGSNEVCGCRTGDGLPKLPAVSELSNRAVMAARPRRRLRPEWVAAFLLLIVTSAACGSGGRIRLPPTPVAPVAEPEEPAIDDGGPSWFDQEGRSGPSRSLESTTGVILPDRTVPPPDPKRPRLNATSPLGTNLVRLTPTSRDRVFVDLFKLATPWVSVGKSKWDDGRPIDIDSNGWVTRLLPRQFVAAQMSAFEGGRFVANYDGLGIIKVQGKGTKVLSDQPGRLEFTATAKSTITIIMTALNPANPLRNLRVLPIEYADYGPEKPFHPKFLKAARRFSTVRFAGWTRAASNPVVEWKDRATTQSARQSGDKGAAYEYMVQLANELRAELWLTIPARASDAHVEELARFIRVNLEPELRVHIEYGDRMTTPDTPGFEYAAAQGKERDFANDSKTAALMFYARRSQEVFALFQKNFEDSSRLVRVIAGSSRSPDDLEAMLSFQSTDAQTDVLAVDVLLGEGIRTADWQTQVRRNDVPWLLDQIEQQALPALLERVRGARKVAQAHGLRLAAYTSGLALRSTSKARDSLVEERLTEANRHPRVEALYAALLDGWRTNGGELLSHAALASRYGKGGRLGAVESVSALETPKFKALTSFMERSPKWWGAPPPAATAAAGSPVAGEPSATADPTTPPDALAIAPEAADEVLGRSPAGTAVALEPAEDRSLVWAFGGLGVASLAASAVFLSMHLDASTDRDVLLAENPSPQVASEGRDLDDQAFMWSVASATSLGVSVASLATAGALSLSEPERRAGQARSTNPWPWLTLGTGLVAAGAGTLYLLSHLDTAQRRDDLLADSGGNSAPLRALDDQALTSSVLSIASFSMAAVSLGLAVYLFVDEGQTLDYEMDVQQVFERQSLIISPSGLIWKW